MRCIHEATEVESGKKVRLQKSEWNSLDRAKQGIFVSPFCVFSIALNLAALIMPNPLPYLNPVV